MKSPEQESRECYEDMQRANQAKELLNNPLYLEAITAIEAAMFMEFQDSKLKDESERHELWQRMQLLKQFKGKFESIVKQGVKAQQTLTMLQKAKKLVNINR